MLARTHAPLAVVVAFLALLPAAPASALNQPNGTPVPSAMGCHAGQPTGLAAIFACACTTPGVCNIGGTCPAPGQCPSGMNGTCETTLSHAFNDNTCIPSQLSGLDPWAAASTMPETFQPTCALTFTVVSRGTATFKDAFGWYNVTGSRPDDDELYPMLDCNAGTGAKAVLDIKNDPRYLGGEIGFFLVTPESRAEGQGGKCGPAGCCASVATLADQGHVYYSQRAFNPDAAGAQSFIHLLTYDSQVTDAKFYFAWEDIYGGSNNDFTDLVTSVEGVECSGGGQACDTGQGGACAAGITVCSGAQLGCTALVEAGAEVCNGIDDDCDGTVDDGATCPGADEICSGGRCVPDCVLAAEFDCPSPLVCDGVSGRCVDPPCEGVTCPASQVCVGGACVAPCDGIVCPVGTTCVANVCLARCDGVTCPGGQVCREGLCFPGCDQCGGLACGGGLSCDASGDCSDPSCPAGCPSGSFCQAGSCKDACEGAICPDGQTCSGGRCWPLGAVPDAGPGPGPGPGPGDDGGDGDGDGGDLPASGSGGGCGCARAEGGGADAALIPLVILAPAVARLRRRRRRSAAREM